MRTTRVLEIGTHFTIMVVLVMSVTVVIAMYHTPLETRYSGLFSVACSLGILSAVLVMFLSALAAEKIGDWKYSKHFFVPAK